LAYLCWWESFTSEEGVSSGRERVSESFVIDQKRGRRVL